MDLTDIYQLQSPLKRQKIEAQSSGVQEWVDMLEGLKQIEYEASDFELSSLMDNAFIAGNDESQSESFWIVAAMACDVN